MQWHEQPGQAPGDGTGQPPPAAPLDGSAYQPPPGTPPPGAAPQPMPVPAQPQPEPGMPMAVADPGMPAFPAQPMPAQPPAQGAPMAAAPLAAEPAPTPPAAPDPAASLPPFTPDPAATPMPYEPGSGAPGEVPHPIEPAPQPGYVAPPAGGDASLPPADIAPVAPGGEFGQQQPAMAMSQTGPMVPVEPISPEPESGPPPAAPDSPAAAAPDTALKLKPRPKGALATALQGRRLRIGEVLIEMGLVDQGQLAHCLEKQKATGERLGRVLISEGLVSATDIARALAMKLELEYVDLLDLEFDSSAFGLMPFDACRKYDAVPLGEEEGAVVVAMADPTNVFAIDDMRLIAGRELRLCVAAPDAIDIVLTSLINLDETVMQAAASAEDWKEDHVALEDIKDSDADAPAVKLVNQILTQAVTTGASDLHFEPQAEDMVVRFRRDGVLLHVATVPNKLRGGVTSRLKIMASLDISERRKPQDGRAPILVGDKPIDLRVATLPTVYGEKTVLRVLDKSNVMLTMDQLGFLPQQLDRFRAGYTQPYGCVLVTGPTGSGKSTTLYAALNEVNDVSKNIITVEDPVEYRLAGINQVQTNPKAGLTFASALRSILRCDPDIVMIGEMRDLETASIGIEAALTGHMVLSTLHTNTAPGAITRLIEMGVEPFLVTSSVLAVLAQRLARRLCRCKAEVKVTPDLLRSQGFPEHIIERTDLPPVIFEPAGCQRCGGTGYRGRLGLHEVMSMSESIESLAQKHASAEEISRVAVSEGMVTLLEDGMAKVLQGVTTMEELQRIVQT